jgi:3-deoxy-D-manno-octulosonate 8-phosphate phosphatase (KDO 8-P phosphatase)
VKHLLQGSTDKLADLRSVLAGLGLTLAQTAVIGDDLPDLPLMRQCGLPIAVANAVEEVKQAAHLVTRRPAGQGAVREALEHVLRRAGRWADVLAHYGLEEAVRPE